MAVFRWTDKAGVDVYVKFDAVSSVELTRETDISEHPVEEGPDVSDHVRARLPRAAVSAYMSNTPLYSNDGVEEFADFENVDLPPPPARRFAPGGSIEQGIRDRAQQPEPGRVLMLVYQDGFPQRVRAVREKLTEAQQNGYLLSLTDADGDFDNLVIERLSTVRTLDDGDGATFQLEVRQIRLTTVEEVDAPEPAEVRGQAPKNLGNQATKPDGEESGAAKQEKLKSIAAGLLDGAAGLF